MRPLALISVLAAAAAAVASAASVVSLSISAPATKVLYGHAITLSGRLSNGAAGRRVSVEARPLGGALTRLATVSTRGGGAWSLRVNPARETSYTARSGGLLSAPVRVDVAPALRVALPARGGVFVHVSAGRSFAGRTVELQRPAGIRWSTFETAVLDTRSDALFAPPALRGRMRVALSVNAAGRGFLGGASDPFRYRTPAPTLAFAPRSATTIFGRSVELAGRISSGRAGLPVVVSSQRYGSARVARTTVLTGAGGRFTLRVAPSIQTSYQARSGSLASPVLVVGVRPSLALSAAGRRLSVRVEPAGRFVGRNVELQRLGQGGWKTAAELVLRGPGGSAVFLLPHATTTVRVAMSVNAAGAGYLEALSGTLALRGASVSIAASSFKVLYGHAVALSGRISSRLAGRQVLISGRSDRRGSAAIGATVLTGAGGRWSFRVSPGLETTYTARSGGAASRPITVGVEPRVIVELLARGRVATRLLAGVPLRGRLVELQRLGAGGRWSTVGRARLDRGGSAVFAPTASLAGATLRVAISVNQSGAGLLGASSHAFVERAL